MVINIIQREIVPSGIKVRKERRRWEKVFFNFFVDLFYLEE